jgi:excisionase family DNA binding protein
MDHLLTSQELADRLNVPVSWVYERTRHNALPGLVRLGKYVRFRESVLLDFIESGGERDNHK